MSPSDLSVTIAAPVNLCELLLRDVASLFFSSRLINQFLRVLRPKCTFSLELVATLNHLADISDAGPARLQPLLSDAGAVLPASADNTTTALITEFLAPLTLIAPGVLAAEIAVNLRLLAQHVELKTQLAAESALLVGQTVLGHALMAWSAEWHRCGQKLRLTTMHARAQAYFADLDATRLMQVA